MRPSLWSSAKRLCAALLLIGAAAVFLAVVGSHYALTSWLFGRYARAWILAGLWAMSLVGTADPLMRRVFRGTLPTAERLVYSFAMGLFGFFLLVFVCGLLHLLGWLFFVVSLGSSCTYAVTANVRYVRRASRLLRRAKGAGRPAPATPRILLALGAIALGLVYLKALSPEHLSYDARWYHFPLAENYAAMGRIARFPEGWYPGAYPQLSSYVYTWALLEPLASTFDRVQLASHLEIAVFVAILASIPVAARRLVHGRRVPGAWTALFLFPAIFAHDGNLTAGADHFAALWTLPILLATLRLWQRLDLRVAVVFATCVAGMADTKYSAYTVVIVACGSIGLRCLWFALWPGSTRAVRRAAVAALATSAMLTIALTAPHWLKNLIWYGDPLYPTLHRWLHLVPWQPLAQPAFDNFFRLGSGAWWMHPAKLTRDGAVDAIEGLFTFSFIPHDWPDFHGDLPIFGSLFTLLGVLLPFVKRPARLAGAYAFVSAAVVVWMFLAPQDRYLQQELPAMAAIVSALLSEAWRMGPLVRGASLLLVGVQMVWGLDVPFLPSDNMVPDGSEIRASEALLSSGYRRDWGVRSRPFSLYEGIGATLPRDAKVLTHEVQTSAGLGTAIANDSPPDQGFFAYSAYRTADDVYRAIRGTGVTHVLWRHEESSQRDSLAGDLVFFWFVSTFAEHTQRFDWLDLGSLPSVTPGPIAVPDVVAVLGCNEGVRDGIYTLADLSGSPFESGRRPPSPRATILGNAVPEEAGFLIRDARCHPGAPAGPSFVLMAKRSHLDLLKRAPRPSPR